MTETVITHPENQEPAIHLGDVDWLPWLAPPEENALTERQRASLVDAARSKSAYFRLLARDPDILEARTRTDKDIFYNTSFGLPRAERELSAAATSRHNGCIYCASVHARHSVTYSKRPEDYGACSISGLGPILASAECDRRWCSRAHRNADCVRSAACWVFTRQDWTIGPWT